MKKLFVYGILRRQYGAGRLLSDDEYKGEYKTAPKYTMISLNAFPGMLKDGDNSITGDLFETSLDTIAKTDIMEGHPTFYERQEVDLEDGTIAEAYFLPREEYGNYPEVKSGDWFKKA